MTFLLPIDCIITSLCTVLISRFSHVLYNIFCCCCDIIMTGIMENDDTYTYTGSETIIKSSKSDNGDTLVTVLPQGRPNC